VNINTLEKIGCVPIFQIFSKGGMKENIIEPEKNIQATIFNIYLL